MKKIISVLIVAILLVSSLLSVIPVSAATTKTIEIDWTKLSYVIYGPSGNSIDKSKFDKDITITTSASEIKANRKAYSLDSNSYVSDKQYEINANTDYTYVVKAKNNNKNKYAGVPFAIDADGYVYFVYGSFDNNNDSEGGPNTTSSYLISAKGDFDYKYPNEGDNEVASKYFLKIQLDNGFAPLQIEYKGLTVTIKAKDSSGNFVKVGDSVTLPEGSKIAIGLFTRDGENNGNRTMTLKDAKITANNEASVKILEGDGSTTTTNKEDTTQIAKDLHKYVSDKEKEFKEADFTAASYKPFKEALASATAIATDKKTLTQATADAAMAAIDAAAAALVPNTTVDFSKLEAAIAKAKELEPYEIEYTNISYAMVTKAISQTDVDRLTDAILGRIEGLIPSGLKVPRPEESAGDATGMGAESESSSDSLNADDGGCGSAVATTAVVVGVVAALGTAIAVKRKED